MAERISTPGGPKALGLQVRAARLDRGHSISELAKAAGVERSRVSKIEQGEFQTMNVAVQKLCKFLAIGAQTATAKPKTPLASRLERLRASCPDAVTAIESLVVALEARYPDARSP